MILGVERPATQIVWCVGGLKGDVILAREVPSYYTYSWTLHSFFSSLFHAPLCTLRGPCGLTARSGSRRARACRAVISR